MNLHSLEFSWLSERLDTDDREPEIIVKVPFLDDISVGLAGADPLLWLTFSLVGGLQLLVQALAGVAVFYLIVRRPKSSITRYLFGYGILIPVLISIPFEICNWLPFKNQFLLFVPSISFLTALRVIASMHGTGATVTERNLTSTVLYYASPIAFQVDEKTGDFLALTREEIWEKGKTLLSVFMQSAVLLNLMKIHDYELFPSKRPFENVLDLLRVGHLLNNYFLAATTSVLLLTPTTFLGLVLSLLSGYSTASLHSNPLTASVTPTDFWSNRWNKMVSLQLKSGIFKPMLKEGFSKGMAILATFLTSGIFHEYILCVISSQEGTKPASALSNIRIVSEQWKFFVWNGAVMALERMCGHWPFFVWMEKNLPRPVRTFLVLMTALPLVHLFTDALIVPHGIYDGLHMALPKLFLNP